MDLNRDKFEEPPIFVVKYCSTWSEVIRYFRQLNLQLLHETLRLQNSQNGRYLEMTQVNIQFAVDGEITNTFSKNLWLQTQ